MIKVCTKCRKERDILEFRRRSRGDLYSQRISDNMKVIYLENKVEILKNLRDAYAINPQKFKDANLKTKYKITREQWDTVLYIQEGKCLACGTTEPGGRHNEWTVDHDHKCCPGKTSCGKCIRGLLCANCNSVIGWVKDNPEILEKQAIYLRSFNKMVDFV